MNLPPPPPPPEIETPLVRKDNFFPDGVLQFNSTASFKLFLDNVADDKYYANKVLGNFNTLKKYSDNFLSRNNQVPPGSNTSSSNTLTPSPSAISPAPLIVDSTEYINDMNTYALPDESLADIVNPEAKVIIADTVYQFTRIGLFKVNVANLSGYTNFFNVNKNSIFFDSNYVKVPNEISLGDDAYQVAPGIIRVDNVSNDILRAGPIEYIDDGGGSGGGGGTTPPINTNYYVNSTVGQSFNKEVGIIFNDWAKRRLVFKTQKINWGIGDYGFHRIDIKAKVQREKKFIWFTYWGPSFADEIIVGCDNMDLETDYIFPYPQQFSTMRRPTFEGLAKFKIGNWVVNTLNLKVNLSALGQSLTNAEISAFVNRNFNSVVGNVYNDGFKIIETKLLNSIDPTYLSTYANYTKKVNSLNESNRLKWVIGKAEKPLGYSHQNTWLFDWNAGGSWSQGGTQTGYPPANYHYNYDMKAGSFFGRARVGNIWHGIRIVRI